MEDWHCKLDVSKVSWTLGHVFVTGGALDRSVDRAKPGIGQTHMSWALILLVHCLWVFYLCYAHVLDLFGRQQPELDLLNRTERRTGVLEVEIRHFRESSGLADVAILKAAETLTTSSL